MVNVLDTLEQVARRLKTKGPHIDVDDSYHTAAKNGQYIGAVLQILEAKRP